MKIVCDNCATKYQIADEKVSGKAFKIRCKKCGHVIVVNKGAGEGGSQASAPEPGPNQETAATATEAASPSEAVWHLVIDREQVGPMTPDEVRTKVRAGQVDAETYGWREGFDDWLKLSAIEDFKGLFAGGDDQSTRRTDAAERTAAAASASPGADLFDGAGREDPARAAATLVANNTPSADAGGFGRANPSSVSPSVRPEAMAAQDQLSVSPATAPIATGSMDGSVQSMTGARSENSVLFSLNNLSALAGANGGGGGGGGGGRPAGGASAGMPNVQSEASGLIDIRAMAAATLGPVGSSAGPASKAPDLFASDAPPVFTPLAPAVLMPSAEPSGVPKWVYALVGLGVLMFIGMVVTLVVVLREPSAPVVATNVPGKDPGTSGTAPTVAAGKEPAGALPSSGHTTTSSPATKPTPSDPAPSGAKPSAASEKTEHSTGSSPSKGVKKETKEPKSSAKETKETKPEREPELAPVSKPEPPAPKKDKPAKPKDDLDSLLDSASSGSGGKPVKAEKKDLPEQLSMSAVQAALKKVDASSCKGEGASGVIKIKLTIKGNGKADAAPADGGPGADCVAKQVKKATFPEFSGDPMTLTYPFIVR